MIEPNSRKLSQRSLQIFSERETTMDQCVHTHMCVMVNFLFALHPIPCLHCVYISGSHISQAPLTEGLGNVSQWETMARNWITRERKSWGILPLRQASLVFGCDCVYPGNHSIARFIPPWIQPPPPHPFLSLVPVSAQWHWWLISSLSNNKTPITFSLLIISGVNYCPLFVFSTHRINSYLN